MKTLSETYGISRIDTDTTSGWEVRLQRDGVKYQRFFSDTKHGSSKRALTAAKKYRNAVNRVHPKREPISNLLEVEVVPA